MGVLSRDFGGFGGNREKRSENRKKGIKSGFNLKETRRASFRRYISGRAEKKRDEKQRNPLDI
jgi:hypothetical protein